MSLAAWQLCARGPVLPTRALEAVDAAAVALVLVGFAAQALLVPPRVRGRGDDRLCRIRTATKGQGF